MTFYLDREITGCSGMHAHLQRSANIAGDKNTAKIMKWIKLKGKRMLL
jgi:hypothetical protein